jgi:hypothetical protein
MRKCKFDFLYGNLRGKAYRTADLVSSGLIRAEWWGGGNVHQIIRAVVLNAAAGPLRLWWQTAAGPESRRQQQQQQMMMNSDISKESKVTVKLACPPGCNMRPDGDCYIGYSPAQYCRPCISHSASV